MNIHNRRVHVIHLVLYHLMVTQEGKDGYFRWNEDICGCIQVGLIVEDNRRFSLISLSLSVTGSPSCLIAGGHSLGIARWRVHSLSTVRPYSSPVRPILSWCVDMEGGGPFVTRC